ncbi:5'-methylthioadenosine/adenosylhomocysteine nucleosidase [Mycoplasmatota bacterium WC44]
MIAVIGAMEVEIAHLESLLENKKVTEISKRVFYSGKISNKDVVVVQAGIGKVNSALTTSILCENFNVDYVINVGVAGGISPVNAKSLVLSDRAVYFDADAVAFGYKIGQIPGEEHFFNSDRKLLELARKGASDLGLEYTVGTIGTGDSFVTRMEQIENIQKEVDDLVAVEMEGASIAQTCELYCKPFIIARSISDVVGSEGQDLDYTEFVSDAAEKASNLVKKIIESY